MASLTSLEPSPLRLPSQEGVGGGAIDLNQRVAHLCPACVLAPPSTDAPLGVAGEPTDSRTVGCRRGSLK